MDVHYQDKHRLYMCLGQLHVVNNSRSLQGNFARSAANHTRVLLYPYNEVVYVGFRVTGKST